MTAKKIKHIIKSNKEDIAFLVGNGINLHYTPSNLSWDDLLLSLWGKYAFRTKSSIPKGVSLTEFYDALEIENYSQPDFSSKLQKYVRELLKDWQPNKKQNILLKRIQELNAPLLTTNIDSLIPRSLDLNFYNMNGKKFTDYYPWCCYFSSQKLELPTDGFGVWYINGMTKYFRSIKLGLAQYMGNIERARNFIHEDPKNINFEGKDKKEWKGLRTWLHIIFNKSLFIFGLSLKECEIFLRWLLIERAKYFKRFPGRKHKGWYLMSDKDLNSSIEGKRFFLEAVGFEILQVLNYKVIYEDIWINNGDEC